MNERPERTFPARARLPIVDSESVERFNRTMQEGWACRQIFTINGEGADALSLLARLLQLRSTTHRLRRKPTDQPRATTVITEYS